METIISIPFIYLSVTLLGNRVAINIKNGYSVAEILESRFDRLPVADNNDRHFGRIEIFICNAVHIVGCRSVDLRNKHVRSCVG